MDRASLLQRLRQQCQRGASHAEHLRQEFLRQRQDIVVDPVRALQQPAAEPRRSVVHGVAGHELLRFDPRAFGIFGGESTLSMNAFPKLGQQPHRQTDNAYRLHGTTRHYQQARPANHALPFLPAGRRAQNQRLIGPICFVL
jgi:hypothetical protein